MTTNASRRIRVEPTVEPKDKPRTEPQTAQHVAPVEAPVEASVEALGDDRGDWSRVSIGSRTVEVYTVGTGDPVLFLHGWGLSPRSYRRAIDTVARGGYRVYAPALPGFGRSDALGLRRQNVAGVAEHIAEVLDRLPPTGPVHVIGHSFGGGVALRLAATHPDRIRSLTLVCPVGGAGNGVVPLASMAVGVIGESRHLWVAPAGVEVAAAFMRHPGSVLATAYAAWRSDQLTDLSAVASHQISTRFLFADHDAVVTAGSIPDQVFERVTCEIVTGHHSWLLTDPQAFAVHALDHLART